MVSAFERPRLMGVVVPLKKEDDNNEEERATKYGGAETETEDEEVKRNCIGGFSGIQDSDISSEDDLSSSSSDDDSDDDGLTQNGEEEEERPEVLNFSTSQVRQSFAIQCPRPTRASPHESLANPASASDVSEMEESDNDDESGSESDDEASDSEESEDDDDEEEETEEEQLEEATVPSATTPSRVPVVRIVESVEKLAQDDHHRKSLIDVEKELQTRHTDLESLIGEDDVEEGEDDDGIEERDDDLMGSAILDRSISRNMPLVGEEPRQQPVKRCLSPESVAGSSDDDDVYSSSSSNKRMRCEDTSTPTLVLPELTLGPSAFLSVPAPSVSPSCCSSETAEDQRLSEELMEATPSDAAADWDVEEREQATVPLLTPPGSPLRVEGTSTTVCEWPSNLTIDNAIHLMPPLMMMNCCTSPSDSSCDELEFGREPTTTSSTTPGAPSHLTPLIRGLAV